MPARSALRPETRERSALKLPGMHISVWWDFGNFILCSVSTGGAEKGLSQIETIPFHERRQNLSHKDYRIEK